MSMSPMVFNPFYERLDIMIQAAETNNVATPANANSQELNEIHGKCNQLRLGLDSLLDDVRRIRVAIDSESCENAVHCREELEFAQLNLGKAFDRIKAGLAFLDHLKRDEIETDDVSVIPNQEEQPQNRIDGLYDNDTSERTEAEFEQVEQQVTTAITPQEGEDCGELKTQYESVLHKVMAIIEVGTYVYSEKYTTSPPAYLGVRYSGNKESVEFNRQIGFKAKNIVEDLMYELFSELESLGHDAARLHVLIGEYESVSQHNTGRDAPNELATIVEWVRSLLPTLMTQYMSLGN